jgi:predicted nucleic acid-binding Zn ribbon protein
MMIPPTPKPGLDGLYRCEACGTLMKEARKLCPKCEKQSNAVMKKKLPILVLCIFILVVVIIALTFFN